MKLDIDHLTKSFGSHLVIPQLTLAIPDCQTLIIIGPSGCGKSTLLRMMAGLEYPDSGSIAFDGFPIVFEEKFLLNYRRSLGIVFQSWNLFPHLTTLENIVLPLRLVKGLSQKEAETLSYELLKRFELEKHADKKPFTLSGGQAQRIAIIRAIAGQPKMLMLDEPTSALDPLMTAEVLELILELKREGRHIILVTHHLNFAKKIADHVLFMAHGEALEQGTVEKVLHRPTSEVAQAYMEKVQLF